MTRKLAVIASAFLLTTSASLLPAQAAVKVSNGVTCAKKNATTKVGTSKYVCTTNPTTTSKKLVWISQDCLDANTAYLAAKSRYETSAEQTKIASKLAQESLQKQIESAINWKASRNYKKGDIVFEKDKTYYIALDTSINKSPSGNLGTLWAVYQPTSADPNVGTLPDAALVISAKQADIDTWTATANNLNNNLQKLQAIKNPDTKTKSVIVQTKTLIATLNSGIKAAKTKIGNIKNAQTLIGAQKNNETVVQNLMKDVALGLKLRNTVCALKK